MGGGVERGMRRWPAEKVSSESRCQEASMMGSTVMSAVQTAEEEDDSGVSG